MWIEFHVLRLNFYWILFWSTVNACCEVSFIIFFFWTKCYLKYQILRLFFKLYQKFRKFKKFNIHKSFKSLIRQSTKPSPTLPNKKKKSQVRFHLLFVRKSKCTNLYLRHKLFHKWNKYSSHFVSRLISSHFRQYQTFFFSFICVKISHAHLDIHHLFWHPSFQSFSSHYFSVVVVVVTNLMWWRWAEKGTVHCLDYFEVNCFGKTISNFLCHALCLVFPRILGFIDAGKMRKVKEKMIQILNYEIGVWHFV